MFRNYLTVAVRNLVRHKVYSFINISGLAIGIAFCILTLLYVRHEWSYDTFHQNADRIYLTRYVYEPSGNRTPTGSTPPILAPTVLENFPEIQRVVRVYGWGIKDGTPVRYGEKLFNRSGYYVDPPFFEMFSFPRVSGNLRTALQNIHSVVISREMARMYFEDENPLDKRVSIRIREKLEDFVVTGVVDIPENSSLQFDFLLSYELKGKPSSGWGQCNVYTYIQLVNPMQAADLERKFPSFVEKYIPAATQRAFDGDQGIQLQLMPLPDLYLNTVIREWLTAQSNPVYSYIFSGIALAVLLIACVNFMNLSVGLSSTRFKEVGMRKVVGATRIHLMRQFFGESILLSALALLVGAAFAELALPTFNALVGRNLSMDYGSDWLALLGLVLIVGLAAGSYPALVLSGFHPVEVLKGRLRIGGTSRFSRVLVVLQFVLSIVLIITTLMMSKQMSFLRTKNLGFDAEQVVVIDTGGPGAQMGEEERSRLLNVYRHTASQNNSILSVSMSNISFGKGTYYGSEHTYEGRSILYRTFVIEYDYLTTLGVALIEGRAFSKDFPADANESILINEAMAQALGWESPIGKRLPLSGHGSEGGKNIIGIVSDFHHRSLHYELDPATFNLKSGCGSLRYVLVKIRPENIPSTLVLLQDTWRQVISDRPFVYSFLDDDVDRTFREDERWLRIIRYSALFAIFIACLGAFGLTSLAVARRTKEIGIRKVLGASISGIVLLLSKEFTKLVIVSNLIAWPVAYWAMNRWLQDFAYRIPIGVGTFILAGVLALIIALLTVSVQAIKAATANPVKALRYE